MYITKTATIYAKNLIMTKRVIRGIFLQFKISFSTSQNFEYIP